MTELIKKLYNRDLRDRIKLTLGLIFALYNGLFGLIFASVWHISIGVYYTLLIALRLITHICLKKSKSDKMSTIVFITTSSLLLLISISLVAPLVLMLRGQRPVPFPLTVAIGIAAYTTYKVTVAIYSFVRLIKRENLLVAEIATIGLIEATVSVLTLQNTLITVNGGAGDEGMLILSAVTSGVGIIAILYLIIRLIVKYFTKPSRPGS